MADIVLRDRSGNPVEYPGVERIKLNTTGGETVEFVDPALIPESVEKTIDPDFSGGDIVEIPEDGTMFSKVTVQKPENLIPGNIAEGVDIAGIIGTLAAGGGGGQAKYAEYSTGSSNAAAGTRISVDFGFIPDFIIMFSLWTGSVTSFGSNGRAFFGFSEAAGSVMGKSARSAVLYGSSSTLSYKEKYVGIESAGAASTHPIYGANETGFNIGGATLMKMTTYYIWAFKLT